MEGFDPKGSAWKKDCSEVVVVSTGVAHEINNGFIDPPPTVDRLIPSFGSTVDKISVPIMSVQVSSQSASEILPQKYQKEAQP